MPDCDWFSLIFINDVFFYFVGLHCNFVFMLLLASKVTLAVKSHLRPFLLTALRSRSHQIPKTLARQNEADLLLFKYLSKLQQGKELE